jgi:hypothetical protein
MALKLKKTEMMNHLQTLKDMATDYNLQIKNLAQTDPIGVSALQEELMDVIELITSTEDQLRELRINILKNSRELLETVKSDPRYGKFSEELKNQGVGGRRKTRKHRKRR